MENMLWRENLLLRANPQARAKRDRITGEHKDAALDYGLEQSFVLLCGYATALESARGAVPMLNLASPFHRNVLRGCANHG